MIRTLCFLMTIIGMAIVFMLPFIGQSYTEFDITQQTIYSSETGSQNFEVELAPVDSPLVAELIFRSQNNQIGEGASATLPIVINDGARDILATSIQVGDLQMRSPVYTEKLEAVRIQTDGLHTVTVGPFVDEGLPIDSVDLRLIGNALGFDFASYVPLGYALLGVGVLGFVFSGRRRQRPSTSGTVKAERGRKRTSDIGRATSIKVEEPKTKQPDRKWGRGD